MNETNAAVLSLFAGALAIGGAARVLAADAAHPAAPATPAAIAASAAPAAPAGGVTLAVLYFDYAGRNPELAGLSKGLAQMLISDLGNVDTLRVVERERLQAVLAEQKLVQDGKIDRASAARIGKLLGARYLVLGSYFDALGTFRADARLVDVETGQIVKSVGAGGKAEDFIGLEQTLADGLSRAAALLTPARASGHAAAAGHPPARRPAKPPRRLKTSTALTYSRALAAADGGDRKQAHALFETVLTEQPDFELAQRDLDKLIQ